MQQYEAKIQIYAETQEEVNLMEKVLFDFVAYALQNGTVISAAKVTDIVAKFGCNPIVINYLR